MRDRFCGSSFRRRKEVYAYNFDSTNSMDVEVTFASLGKTREEFGTGF